VLAPSHWDVAFIRRFMVFFGPLSSLFDFVTFAVLLGAFDAGPELFRTGWFIESLATQTLVIFAIRTRRIPFWRSRPSWQLMVAALSVVVVGVLITVSPVSELLGFTVPPPDFLAVVAVMVLAYLLLIEGGKRVFYADHRPPPVVPRVRDVTHQVHRRAARSSPRGAITARRSRGAGTFGTERAGHLEPTMRSWEQVTRCPPWSSAPPSVGACCARRLWAGWPSSSTTTPRSSR